jgi:hypothetical protein
MTERLENESKPAKQTLLKAAKNVYVTSQCKKQFVNSPNFD